MLTAQNQTSRRQDFGELPPPPPPQHIAIIMDGNGRWATSRGLPRIEGHRRGVDALRNTVKAAKELGVQYLTVFAFSSENWQRPATEITGLMTLIRYGLKRELAELHKNGVCLRVIGKRDRLPKDVVEFIDYAQELTKDNTNFYLVIALDYGARDEIIAATKKIASQVQEGNLAVDAIDENIFAQSLYTSDIPDPDLLIRTSGEQRISNFLLWQLSYTELHFTQAHWPDFGKAELSNAIESYRSRDRRYGAVRG